MGRRPQSNRRCCDEVDFAGGVDLDGERTRTILRREHSSPGRPATRRVSEADKRTPHRCRIMTG